MLSLLLPILTLGATPIQQESAPKFTPIIYTTLDHQDFFVKQLKSAPADPTKWPEKILIVLDKATIAGRDVYLDKRVLNLSKLKAKAELLSTLAHGNLKNLSTGSVDEPTSKALRNFVNVTFADNVQLDKSPDFNFALSPDLTVQTGLPNDPMEKNGHSVFDPKPLGVDELKRLRAAPVAKTPYQPPKAAPAKPAQMDLALTRPSKNGVCMLWPPKAEAPDESDLGRTLLLIAEERSKYEDISKTAIDVILSKLVQDSSFNTLNPDCPAEGLPLNQLPDSISQNLALATKYPNQYGFDSADQANSWLQSNPSIRWSFGVTLTFAVADDNGERAGYFQVSLHK